ncbi:unnamed protein product [Linum tenue]|nr:unnamed protein product [Linum tenue]
MGPRSIS